MLLAGRHPSQVGHSSLTSPAFAPTSTGNCNTTMDDLLRGEAAHHDACYTLAWGTWVNHVIPPRSCITPEDNTSSQSLLKTNRPCYQIVLPNRRRKHWLEMMLSSIIGRSGFRFEFRSHSVFIRLFVTIPVNSAFGFGTVPVLHAQAWYQFYRYQATADLCVTSRGPWMFHLLGVSRFTDTGALFGFPGRQIFHVGAHPVACLT